MVMELPDTWDIVVSTWADAHPFHALHVLGIRRFTSSHTMVSPIRRGVLKTLMCAKNMLPQDAIWTGPGIARRALPMLMQASLLGGDVRIGVEDVIGCSRDELVNRNAGLVDRARCLIEKMGSSIASRGAGSRLRFSY